MNTERSSQVKEKFEDYARRTNQLLGWVYEVAHRAHPMIVAQDILDQAEEDGVELIENQEDIRHILEDEATENYGFEKGEFEY
jgi:glycine/D-amino acid oxidase-like deaminating enzyme